MWLSLSRGWVGRVENSLPRARRPKLEPVSDQMSGDSRAWASSTVRQFAAATNLLVAGRRFSIHGSGQRESALAVLLTAIGARRVAEGERPDYLFCTGEGVDPLNFADAGSDGERNAESRPLVVVDVTTRGRGIAEEGFGPLVEFRAGVFATVSPHVFLVRPELRPGGAVAGAVGASGVGSTLDTRGRIEWARRFMPVMATLVEEIAEAGLVDGVRIGLSMVLEPKTAVFALALRDARADVTVFAHPDETDDAIADILRNAGIPVWARSGADATEHRDTALAFLDARPQLLVDDGSHLIRLAHSDRPEVLTTLTGAAEETTSGLRPLRLMASAGVLRIPVIAVNDARSKTLFDNRYGTGQSCVFTILDLLAVDPAGQTVVVAGYGHVGEGVAHHARALGATVVVAELDPVRALQASFAGHRVVPLLEAVRDADIVISATGVRDTISLDVLLACATDAAIAVAGGVPQEVAIDAAVDAGATRETVGDRIERFTFPGGSSILILDDGGCINVTAGEGNPIEIMDLSFAVQASAIRYLAENSGALLPEVHDLPADADDAVASIALRSSGVEIDSVATQQASAAATSVDWHSQRFREQREQ
jgi:adenosylhomocysteinase